MTTVRYAAFATIVNGEKVKMFPEALFIVATLINEKNNADLTFTVAAFHDLTASDSASINSSIPNCNKPIFLDFCFGFH